jgi:hypothetical protein
MLPTGKDAERVYHGEKPPRPMSQIERLLEADPTLKFNGSGQMRTAFFTDSRDWEGALEDKKENWNGDEKSAEKELREEREGERQAMLAWIRAGARKEAWDEDHFDLPKELHRQPLTQKFQAKGDLPAVKIFSLFKARCITCHQDGGKAKDFPLVDFHLVHPRVTPEPAGASTAMSLTKLAQTTHVHLLGFSMLYGLTGFIFAFTTYPCWVRVVLCPLPLIAQVIDISFWWLARVDSVYAHFIVYTGGIVAVGLLLQITLSLLNMFGSTGKVALLLMFCTAGAGAVVVKQQIIDPYLEKEKTTAVSPAKP